MGTIHQMDSFLTTLSNRLGRNEVPKEVKKPNWSVMPQLRVLKDASKDELVDVLKNQCKNIHTECIETNKEGLNKALIDLMHKLEVKKVVTWRDERFQELGLLEHWKEVGVNVHQWNEKEGKKNIDIAEAADAGITFTDVTLAESATLVLFSGEGRGRSVSLLPKYHIAIVPKSTIVPRMTQATKLIHEMTQESNGERIPSCINFITGPSNSADIELNLVVGVHGPLKAAYIVVEDM